jgi:hypothetical protein
MNNINKRLYINLMNAFEKKLKDIQENISGINHTDNKEPWKLKENHINESVDNYTTNKINELNSFKKVIKTEKKKWGRIDKSLKVKLLYKYSQELQNDKKFNNDTLNSLKCLLLKLLNSNDLDICYDNEIGKISCINNIEYTTNNVYKRKH